MKRVLLHLIIIIASCTSHAQTILTSQNIPTKQDINLFDKSRNRIIPIQNYFNSTLMQSKTSKRTVVIINHGYTIKNSEYSFLAKALASQGYFVVSILHDLKSDPDLPKKGNLIQIRKPMWERGVQNILFTISKLKSIDSNLNLSKLILIGHSNGGDISMLFAERHPELVTKVVSLDSLRYPFPRNTHVSILSLRTIDTKADDGVIPKKGAAIINLKGVKHIDMCDRGPLHTKQKITTIILKFLDKESQAQDELTSLETSSGGRLGISAINTANNQRIQFRAYEIFPMGISKSLLEHST